MKAAKLFLPLVLLAALSAQARAEPRLLDCRSRTEAMNVLTDVIFVRPAGLLGTVLGGALFVAVSPLTAMASIPPPHDAFQRVGAFLVGAPYAYTFVRPVGEFGNTCL